MLNYNQLANRSLQNRTLSSFIRNFDDYTNEANRIKNSWNNTIRTFYRDAMGVGRLLSGSRVEILIAPDDWIVEVLENDFPNLDINEERALRAIIAAGYKNKHYLPQNLERSFDEIIQYAQNKIDENDLSLLIRRLFEHYHGKMKSPFGVYKINSHSIELYLLPMLLFCEAYEIDFESFFIVVFAHELAHLYNHVGEDKDGYHWENFEQTDDFLAEGLAQYYTWQFLMRYESKLPKGGAAFETLESRQNEPYKWFRIWGSTLEQTYFGFIEARRNNVYNSKEFKDILEHSKSRIKDDA